MSDEDGQSSGSSRRTEADARRYLRRGASAALLLQGGANVLQYLVQLVLARMLTLEAFGTYTYAITWARIAGDMCDLGGASSSLRLLPEYTVHERWELSAGVLVRSRQLALAVSGVVAVVGTGVLLAMNGSSGSDWALVGALLLIPAVTLIELQTSLTRAFERVFKAFFPWLVFQPLVLILCLVIAYVTGAHLGAEQAMVLTAISFGTTILLQLKWLSRAVPPLARSATPRFAHREWAKVSLPIFGSNIVSTVFSRLDIVMVGILLSASDAGVYAVAMRGGMAAALLQTAICANLAPRMSRLFWDDRPRELDELVLTALRWAFLPSLAVTVGLIAFGRPLLGLFGDQFEQAWDVLVIIAVGQLIGVGAGPVGWLLNMTGQHNVTFAVFAATAVATVIAYLVLIPWLGLPGAAIANGGAVAVRSVALNAFARRRLGLRVSVLRSLRPRQ